MQRWYVIKTKPKKEDAVMAQLHRASVEVFLPKMKTLASSPCLLKPLFPSYFFIHTDFDDPSIHRMVRFTRGVSRILGDESGPQPIPSIIVETLREQSRNGSLIEQDLLFRPGDEVTVKRGILKDLQGIIEKNIPESGRVKVLFKWINGSMRAVLRYTELKKAA